MYKPSQAQKCLIEKITNIESPYWLGLIPQILWNISYLAEGLYRICTLFNLELINWPVQCSKTDCNLDITNGQAKYWYRPCKTIYLQDSGWVIYLHYFFNVGILPSPHMILSVCFSWMEISYTSVQHSYILAPGQIAQHKCVFKQTNKYGFFLKPLRPLPNNAFLEVDNTYHVGSGPFKIKTLVKPYTA